MKMIRSIFQQALAMLNNALCAAFCLAPMLLLAQTPSGTNSPFAALYTTNNVSAKEAAEGFVSLFDGRTFKGWRGLKDDFESYYIRSGMLICKAQAHQHIFTEGIFSDFILRFDFKLEPGGNNGVALRARFSRTPGMEIQIHDDSSEKAKDLKDYQLNGSLYGLVPARAGHLKPVGEWNRKEIVCQGRNLKVSLNGTVILDANLDQAASSGTPSDRSKLLYEKGHICLMAHGYGAQVFFRNLRVKPLKPIEWPDLSQPLLKSGFAETDITPEIGMEEPGGYGKVFHKKIHDPCKVRASVFDDGRKQVAVVGVDACFLSARVVQAARNRIERDCGIAAGSVMIAASHSHSSGPTGMVQPGEYDHAPAFVQKLAYEKSSCANPEYLKRVEDQIVAAVRQAWSARQETQCGAGMGIEDQAAFNRRFLMKNGQTFTHPDQNNPDTIRPAGPIDPGVGVIGAWNKDGQLIGCIVNYACHATTSPGGASANYIYYLEQTIRGAFGKDVVVVFVPGASGDVTQVNNDNLYRHPQPEDWCRLVGGRVGAEAVKILLSMARGGMAPIDFRNHVLKIPRRKPAAERVESALALVQKDPKEVGATEWSFAKEIVMLDALMSKTPVVDVEVQAVQIGPAVLLANPSETFCQLGLTMKGLSPFPFTFPVSLANGCVGYVPTEAAFAKSGGGYETRLTSYSNLQTNAGTRIVDALVGLTRQMEPGALPPRMPAKPFRAPWSYGSVPPELE